MKVEVTSAAVKKFVPVTLTITFETRDELLDMYARHCVGNHKISDVYVVGSSTNGISDFELISAVHSTAPNASGIPLLVVLKEEILK